MLTGLAAEVQADTASLRCVVCGAAPMPAAAIHAFEDRYGVSILEGYGQSEGTVVTTANPLRGLRKPGTVGLPLPGQEVRIVGKDDEPLPAGQVGEVTVRGPNVMRGYLGKPAETAETLRRGWLHTGDLGRFDEDGYLVLVDRLKDMIIRGGENIYPREIEQVLFEHPTVADVAVVGVPDATWGEQVAAFVRPAPGQRPDPDELFAYCREHLAPHKTPRYWTVVEESPQTPSGKIQKFVLRERFLAQGLTSRYEPRAPTPLPRHHRPHDRGRQAARPPAGGEPQSRAGHQPRPGLRVEHCGVIGLKSS
jgi:acyl-CoA synthetase (AMP-forming)/AMP-acid ligase II